MFLWKIGWISEVYPCQRPPTQQWHPSVRRPPTQVHDFMRYQQEALQVQCEAWQKGAMVGHLRKDWRSILLTPAKEEEQQQQQQFYQIIFWDFVVRHHFTVGNEDIHMLDGEFHEHIWTPSSFRLESQGWCKITLRFFCWCGKSPPKVGPY